MTESITQIDVEKSVKVSPRGALVRSDNLAKIFNRTHKQVLALIRTNIEFFRENNLSPKTYFFEEVGTTVKGNEFTRYQLTRKGFDLIALSLKGKEAKLYKIWYIDSFHKKQEVIEEHKLTAKVNMSDDLWMQFRKEGIEFRNKLTKAIDEKIVKYRNEVEFKMNDGKYYYHYTSLIYSILGIDLPKGTNPRDVLDKRMLVRLEDMEDKVAGMVMSIDGHYKDVYKTIKEELTND